MTGSSNNYDLEERTVKFSEKLIYFFKRNPKNTVTLPLIDQGIRSGTSIGANYREANGASSKKDFQNKIFICKKESKETMHWLRMLSRACETVKDECRELWGEVYGYAKMFSEITSSLKK